MKKFKLYIIAFLTAILFATGCDKGFDEMNVNPLLPTYVDPTYLLNSAINNLAQNSGDAVSQFYHITQMFVTPFGGDLQGANYNMWHSRQNTRWSTLYESGSVDRLVWVIDRVKNDPTRSNLYNAARILKAYAFQQLTDTYGDVPYFEAALGFPGGYINYDGEKIEKPRYDKQQDIYMDLLKEYDEASAAMDATKSFPSEILFGVGGNTNTNVTKWKRFGYSMLLRTAMRLSNVDPVNAEKYVKKAVAGGLMQSNADNAKYAHTAEFSNSIGSTLTGTERSNYFATDVYVEFLKSKNDPRLGALTQRFVGAVQSGDHVATRKTKDPAQQIGMPVGYNQNTIAEVTKADPRLPDDRGAFYGYTSFDNALVYTRTTPEWHCNYGQTQLLLAEAIVRGWVTDQGTAAAAYERGIKANMELLAEINSQIAIPAADITAYIAANPLSSDKEKAIEQINYEYWVGSLPTCSAIEGWANWRRTDYPKLTANKYESSEVPGDFIRRHKYPDRENITNKDNLMEALNRIGGKDAMNVKGWWDKK